MEAKRMKPAVTASQVKIVSVGLRRSADQTRGRYFMSESALGRSHDTWGPVTLNLTRQEYCWHRSEKSELGKKRHESSGAVFWECPGSGRRSFNYIPGYCDCRGGRPCPGTCPGTSLTR